MGQDLDVREIAGLLDLSAQTVKSHLYQARRRLAPLLDDPVDSASDPPTEA
jgi:DNA-directed RNA polymerase specialized sigma24 family protein